MFCNAKSPNTYLTVYFYLKTWGWCSKGNPCDFFILLNKHRLNPEVFFLYRKINKNNLHKYLGTEKNEPVTCLSDLLNIKQIVKLYKRVSNIFEE